MLILIDKLFSAVTLLMWLVSCALSLYVVYYALVEAWIEGAAALAGAYRAARRWQWTR